MSADNPDDRMADLLIGTELQPALRRRTLARIGLVRHPHVGAQHVDAGLPVLLPVISQARHGVYRRQANGGWLVGA